MKGVEYLRKKLAIKRVRVLTRYTYYEMKNSTLKLGKLIDEEQARQYKSVLGWCANAVDAMADRLQFDGFNDDNFDLKQIFDMNNPDIFFDSAMLSALISSCCFVYISTDEDGFPRLQVIDGANATGIIDPITGLLTEGYAVISRDPDTDEVTKDAYFAPFATTIYDKIERKVTTYDTGILYPALVPIINRPDAKRPFGHSRISRSCMNIMDKARMTLTRSDITAEFYSWPQRYVLGLSDDAEFDGRKASMSSFIAYGRDEEGNVPSVGQFTQQNMEPHIDQFKMYASEFSGETGLTLDDLGFPTDNPSSADAIKAAHENLRLKARKAQRTFGSGFLNVGFVAACMRDNYQYKRQQIYMTTPEWCPLFEPDASQLSGVGDAAIKLNQAIPGYLNEKNMKKLTGISGGTGGSSVQASADTTGNDAGVNV